MSAFIKAFPLECPSIIVLAFTINTQYETFARKDGSGDEDSLKTT
jgi:hypothetical protein